MESMVSGCKLENNWMRCALSPHIPSSSPTVCSVFWKSIEHTAKGSRGGGDDWIETGAVCRRDEQIGEPAILDDLFASSSPASASVANKSPGPCY